MYIYGNCANIIFVLKTVLIFAVILIFPIFLNFDFVIKNDLKRLWFGFHLYGIIKIFGGYAERINGGFAIHLSKNKAIILNYSEIFGAQKKIKPLKDYHFIRFYSLLEIGSETDEEKAFAAAFITSYFGETAGRYLGIEKPYLKIQNDVNLFMREDVFNFYFSGTVVFNLLMICLSIIKICTGKIVYAFGKGK